MKKTLVLKSLVNGNIVSENVTVETNNTFDIIIAGLGTAGALSAVCCAESGLKVFSVDRLSGMGGIGTLGGVWSYFFGSSGGKFEEINSSAESFYKKGYSMSEPQDGIGELLYFWNPEGVSLGSNRYIPGALKEYVIENSVNTSNCTVSLNSTVCGVYLEDNRVCGIRYLKNGKFYDVFAKTVIDALGDAFISKLAGSPTDNGRTLDSAIMNFVKIFTKRENSLTKGCFYSTGSNRNFNTLQLSHEYLRTTALMDMKAKDDCRITGESSIPTLREVSHIKGLKTLTLKDCLLNDNTEEPLFYFNAPLDNTNHDIGFESFLQQNWNFICGMDGKYAISCGVPMKMLFPADKNGNVIENIVTIGRGMSIDHDICGCFRMKKDYEKLGEAAATICIYAVKNRISPHNVKYEDIKPILKKSGCLDENANRPITDFFEKDGKYNKQVFLPKTREKQKEVLESESPWTAYWTAFKYGKNILDENIVEKALKSGKHQRKYAVFTALAGCESVLSLIHI